MAIRWYESEPGTHRFGFFCEECGKRIENADEGIAIHVEMAKGSTDGPVGFVHKGDCDDKYSARVGADASSEIDALLVRLGNGSGVNWKEAHERVRLLAENF